MQPGTAWGHSCHSQQGESFSFFFFFFLVTTFPQAIDLEEKPSFPNYKTTHAVGTFSHELPMMCFAFNPEIFPVPTQGTNTASLGGRGDPLAVPGGRGHAWGQDQPPTSGRFASPR